MIVCVGLCVFVFVCVLRRVTEACVCFYVCYAVCGCRCVVVCSLFLFVCFGCKCVWGLRLRYVFVCCVFCCLCLSVCVFVVCLMLFGFDVCD